MFLRRLQNPADKNFSDSPALSPLTKQKLIPTHQYNCIPLPGVYRQSTFIEFNIECPAESGALRNKISLALLLGFPNATF